ncbi:Serine/threonine-protein phosphatase with EF-hands [Echinococcus granulosus]|uniref:Serine/threonine-protein phosphatase n=1 Tax=Echinococcus granulosus TaxID=6210 RepID=W6V6L7_ECHGR|nr:Serine/threonine-protein phosphatase with EF-hands [Echinococcus granulosus]EUB62039.1 Serine/threonine-protein phosphatase with EF-hands [Echinococcus granulosus]
MYLASSGCPTLAKADFLPYYLMKHGRSGALKAALLIQTWYRRHQAELELRRRCAWKIYEFFEYTGADDQRHPSWPMAKMRLQSKSSFSQNLERRLQKVTIAGKGDARWKNSTIRFHESQWHSRFNNDYIQSLIEFQKQGKILDSDLVTEVLEEATLILQALPNIQRASTTLSQRITICGDLHGQVEDLALIFQAARPFSILFQTFPVKFANRNGLPDVFNPYVFNGDFVDRGNNSIEVLVILLSCLLAHPSAVFLNRGNHEDPILNKRYGFADEVRSKYPKQYKKILKQTEPLFCAIPLCTILDDVILVCHGGISRTTDLTKVTKLDRKLFFSVLQPPLEGEKAVSIDDWRQVLDLLWSDPQSAPGCKPNIKRGGGSHFGPDITASLLNHLKVGILIRSHECCPNGWKMDHNNQVLTVFSASNYYGTDSNLGAFIQLSSKRVVGSASAATRISIMEPVKCELDDLPMAQASAMGDESATIAASTNTSARISYTRVMTPPENGEETANRHKQIVEILLAPRLVMFRTGWSSKHQSLLGKRNLNDAAYRMLLRRILSRRETIVAALCNYDPQRTGEVKITQWCTVMLKHAGQNLPWRILRYSLVKSSPTRPKTHVLYMSMFDPKHEIFSESTVSLPDASADAVSSSQGSICS